LVLVLTGTGPHSSVEVNLKSVTDATAGASETVEETWQPSDAHRPIPTLVVTCGLVEAQTLQAGVEERLGEEMKLDAVRWGQLDLDEVLEPGEDEAPEQLELRLARLLSPLVESCFFLV
jgi:hypothetical protein